MTSVIRIWDERYKFQSKNLTNIRNCTYIPKVNRFPLSSIKYFLLLHCVQLMQRQLTFSLSTQIDRIFIVTLEFFLSTSHHFGKRCPFSITAFSFSFQLWLFFSKNMLGRKISEQIIKAKLPYSVWYCSIFILFNVVETNWIWSMVYWIMAAIRYYRLTSIRLQHYKITKKINIFHLIDEKSTRNRKH